VRNLLILIDGDFVGGAETNYRYILPGLLECGWRPIFICPDDRNLRRYFSSLGFEIATETGYEIYPPFSVGGRVSPRNLLKVFGAVRRNRKKVLEAAIRHEATAVVSNSMVSHLLNAGIPASSGLRRVVHLHDIVDRRKAKGLYGKGLDRIARRADAIITISDAVEATLPADALSKAVKLYNPIGDMPIRRRAPGLPIRAGMFARYTPWKGHRDLLEIVKACSDLPIEFVSFGNVSDNDQAHFETLTAGVAALENPGQMRLNGFSPDPMQEMADCDYVLHLSTLPEPFGRVLIEANACGVPVLAYRGGGVDEIFGNLELVGERFANGDWRTMAEVLRGAVDRCRARPSAGTDFKRPASLESLSIGRYAEAFLEVCNGS
jgi:glycosyltransferase involved in cell wall biosynthesis